MKVAVVGAGGVGGYYAAVLGQQHHEVSLIARGAHLRAIRERGLQIRTPGGEFVFRPARITDIPDEIGVADVVIFCTKAYDLPAAARAAVPMVGAATTAFGLQNGLDAHEVLGAVLGAEHVIAGVTGIYSNVEAPGIIRKTSAFAWILIGELDRQVTARVRAICEAFAGSDVSIEPAADILAEIWGKLIISCALFGAGSLTRLPLGDYRSVPETRRTMDELMREAAAVAAAAGVRLEPGVVEKWSAGIDGLMPGFKPSMQLDVEAGHRIELEATIGALCRKGRSLGVATPVADVIYAALLPLELKARGE